MNAVLGSGWWRWVVYDVPANASCLPKGAGAEHSSILPAGTRQGRTDLGNDAYHGLAPAKESSYTTTPSRFMP
jgi:phosphatidylethanolamine-binding protein (PEBP) family uncharacterized protein